MTIYRVNDVYASVQGEGCQTGVPMVLLRLHGCGVGCPWCDTKETWHVEQENLENTVEEALDANVRWCWMSASEIAAYVRQNYPTLQWVLVTGGEPADKDLAALAHALHDAGYRAALETSGTADGHLNAPFDWVCVSPKIGMPGGKVVLPEALAVAHEIKHVVGRQADIDNLDDLLKRCTLRDGVQICLQPVSTSEKATQLCIETVQSRAWRLSVQTHKYISVR